MAELSIEDKARIARREYMRKWREKNKEKERANRQRFWAKKFEEMKMEDK